MSMAQFLCPLFINSIPLHQLPIHTSISVICQVVYSKLNVQKSGLFWVTFSLLLGLDPYTGAHTETVAAAIPVLRRPADEPATTTAVTV